MTPDSLAIVNYEFRAGDVVWHTKIKSGKLEAEPGPLPDADAVIEAGPGLRLLMAREMTPSEALKAGVVRVHGRKDLLDLFVSLFRI